MGFYLLVCDDTDQTSRKHDGACRHDNYIQHTPSPRSKLLPAPAGQKRLYQLLSNKLEINEEINSSGFVCECIFFDPLILYVPV